jgi:hypothetical protein
MTTEGDRLDHITEDIAEQVYLCLKAGLTHDEIIRFLTLARVATERGHNTVALPFLPKMKSPG